LKLKIYLLLILFFLVSCKKEIIEPAKTENKFYDKAYDFLSTGEKDSAFVYFNLAQNTFSQNKDSARIGNSMVNMAILQSEAGDYYGSQETSLGAIKYLNKKEEKLYPILYSNYNNLGITSRNLGDYKNAVLFYDNAIAFATSQSEINTCLNNKAICYKFLENYSASLQSFKDVFKNIDPVKDQKGYARIVDNLAFVKFLQNKNYNAEMEMNEALKIREKAEDLWGQNASHSHLSDYFEDKSIEKSLFHAHRMYEISKKIKSPDDQLEALQKLVDLENPVHSKKYYKIYVNLEDSLTNVRNKAKNQFALIRYDSEKNRVDFLKAEAKNIENRYQILQRNIALGAVILALIFAVFWNRKRKERLKQEKIFEVKSTALKYSKKVHDVVSNGIYQVMSEIENTSEIDKEGLLDKLEIVYEKSRDISYEDLTGNADSDFKMQIANLTKSFSSETLKTIIIGNEEILWSKIPQDLKTDIKLILQELLVNTKKHSEAKKIILKFEIVANRLQIAYSDDGIGFTNNIKKKNGLQNVETRIFSQKGNLTFGETTGKGANVFISFPLKKG
jgi:two-component sensor histidine kinase